MPAKIIDLATYRKKQDDTFNKSRDKLIADLDRSGVLFDTMTPLAEQLQQRRIEDIKEIFVIMGINIVPIEED